MKTSVVIPSYNAAEWLSVTTSKVVDALKEANIKKAEIVIVDDGSTDNTSEKVKSLDLSPYQLVFLKQENKGRFLARKKGIEYAKYENILLIDTRVHIDVGSIQYLKNSIEKHPYKKVWNGHVNVYKKGNMIARFMDTITNIGWKKYFKEPKDCDYGIDEFDFYPKGTGCFFVEKKLITSAIKDFMKTSKDLKNSSDDTLLIRLIANKERINLSPKFSCTYYARNKIGQFIPHTMNRGKFFVDGFLIKGTRFYPWLIAYLVSSPIMLFVLIAAFVFYPLLSLVFLALLLLFIIIYLKINNISWKDSLSFIVLLPLFILFYSIGIWQAVIVRIKNNNV